MISACTQHGYNEEAWMVFLMFQRACDETPNEYVLASVIRTSTQLGSSVRGSQLHSLVVKTGLDQDVYVGTSIVDLYSKLGKNAFDREAMSLFINMTRNGWKPDGFACTSVLTSCASLEALEPGMQTHAYTVKTNMDKDEFVNNGLIDMYSKCNCLADARRAFDGIPHRNVIGYNAMIEGYSRIGNLNEALDLFREMRLGYLDPSLLTFVSLLGVSASLLTLELSKQIHGFIIKFGVSLDVFAGSALIDVYSKCSFTFDARRVFDEMSEKDIVVWNSMLFGYTQKSENESALRLYQELQLSCLQPNEFTFVALIIAASNLASLPIGHQFHTQLLKTGLNLDPFVTNALLDMYAKCGSKQEARNLFDSTRKAGLIYSVIDILIDHDELMGFRPSTSHEIMPFVPTTIEGCMWRCNRSHADGDHDGDNGYALPMASLQGDYKYAYATFEGDSDDDDADYDYAPAA
ncbi:hypothetical protein L6452_21720 [Arctium lappa]|uniref:Uncharacterized protein n=1 Tax=Arctium lappa TaxID=4217 RepID=A0ACB9AZ45_ARCLA|nr:hypothetical protein L6452_21720 [Arctium lappa]